MNQPDPTADFDGCNRKCRKAAAHTRVWGECEFGIQPEPTVSMSRVYTDFDGCPSIGFDQYTVDQLAELLDPVLGSVAMRARTGSVDLAHLAAHAIVHRNDEPAAASAVVASPTDRGAAIASCPGYETSPNPCRCPCYGCKHHCSAHNPEDVPTPAVRAAQRERIAEERVARHLAAKDHPRGAWEEMTERCRSVYLADARAVLAVLPEPAEVEQLRTENARMRHELEVMYGGAFDNLKPAPADRAAVSAALWTAAEHHTVAEWICCDPIDPTHALCVQGGAALRMLKALLVDDPEAWKPAPLLDEVMRLVPPAGSAAEAHRLALSEALGLGTGAPWDAIRERVGELAADPDTFSGRLARLVARDASALRMDLYEDLAAFARDDQADGADEGVVNPWALAVARAILARP
jgi:hypothetical protein